MNDLGALCSIASLGGQALVVVEDADHVLCATAQATEHLASGRLEGRRLRTVVDNAEALVAALRAASQATQPVPVPIVVRAATGARPLRARAARLARSDPRVAVVVQSPHGDRFRELTQRIDALNLEIKRRSAVQAELEALNAELERRVEERTRELGAALRTKDDFLASMSHELRTPLNVVIGLAESLELGVYGALTREQQRALDRIGESGAHLLELIGDILDVAKSDAGKLELQRQAVDLGELCAKSLRLVEQAANAKRQRVSVSSSCAGRTIPGDERRLRQVLVNLLSNAVKFTPEGGAFGVDVAAPEEEGVARITVWDTGIGIDPEHLQHIFEPFVQLSAGLNRRYGGTGLGLTLARRLVELHGGRVEVESKPGEGSRFSVLLPLR